MKEEGRQEGKGTRGGRERDREEGQYRENSPCKHVPGTYEGKLRKLRKGREGKRGEKKGRKREQRGDNLNVLHCSVGHRRGWCLHILCTVLTGLSLVPEWKAEYICASFPCHSSWPGNETVIYEDIYT